MVTLPVWCGERVMAEFRQYELPEQRISVFEIKGSLVAGELANYLKACDYEFRHYRTLWDMREATWSGIPTTKIIAALPGMFKYSREGQRTAFVYGQDVDFGIARMLEPHLRIVGIRSAIYPFKDWDEAISWLLTEQASDFHQSPSEA